MELKINKIVLDNFRGYSHKEIELKPFTLIKGQNGSGKSTIFSAVEWVFCDVDSNLVKNPNVVPIGNPECVIEVKIEATMDEKPVTFGKKQKYREKVDEWGKKTSSNTNSYSINDVEKSYTNFIKELNERGIDLDKFLVFSHPNAFLADTSAKGREKIREILFSMVGVVSDQDVALRINATEVANLLETYTLEEIKAKQKSTIKAIKEETGLNNEVINAKIDGLLSSKTKLDVDILKEQKANYEAEILRIESELADISEGKLEQKKKLSELRIKEEEIKNEASLQLNKNRDELKKRERELAAIIDENVFRLGRIKSNINNNETLLSEAKQDIENQRVRYKIEQDAVLDESDLSCPCCFRPYEADKLASIKAEFEKNKAEKLKSIKCMGDDLKTKIEGFETELNGLEKDKNNIERLIDETQKMRDDIQKRLDEMPTNATYELPNNPEYVEATREILALETELMKSDDSRKNALEESKAVAKEMLNNVMKDLGKVEKNKEIDERVNVLREERRQAEINKANAEKVLDEVAEVEKAKNQTYADNINSHFSLVNWHLWDVRKNGDYVEITEPYIDGKPMTSAANGSLMTLAKISICADLQKFFNQNVPIFIEDFSLFSNETRSRIDVNSQLIGLVVSEDKEVVVV